MKQAFWIIALLLLAVPVSASVQDEIDLVIEEVKPLITDPDNAVIVKGRYSSAAERVVLTYLRNNYPDIKDVRTIKDSSPKIPYETVFLVGGPMQNLKAKYVLDLPQREEMNLSFGRVSIHEGEKTYIVFSDRFGYDNFPKTGPSRSPLRAFLPEEYVPVAASVLTLFLLLLGKFLLNLLLKIFRFKVASKIMGRVKKHDLRDEFKGFHIKGVRFKYREALAITIAAFVFAAAVSYNYLFNQDVLLFILTNTGVNLVIYAVRHGIRLYLDKHHGHHTEYRIWYWGAILTVFSGWLGNTFSLAGYTVSDEKGKERQGVVNFIVNIVTFFIFLVTAIWNIMSPEPLVQMIMVLSVALSFLFMLPFDPFGGKKVYQWKSWLWWVSFVPIAVCYVWVSLVP